MMTDDLRRHGERHVIGKPAGQVGNRAHRDVECVMLLHRLLLCLIHLEALLNQLNRLGRVLLAKTQKCAL